MHTAIRDIARRSTDRDGRRIRMHGTVQGVGFRPWVYRVAAEAGVTGRVRNDSAGVTIEAFGTADRLDAFVDHLADPSARPAAAVVDRMFEEPMPFEETEGFSIVASQPGADMHVSIPPDLTTCPDCLAEIGDPADRRFGYAFTNCTNCGPRFTIVRAAPYDRPATSMAAFAMCPSCQHEYDSVADRRFHAQPNACPQCGPRLDMRRADGRPVGSADAIDDVARGLRDGLVVAVKGIGGFQLACDATADAAVRRLRDRKRRDEKPLAVMVRTIADAEALAELLPAERRLLLSPERPIVLVRRRAGTPLAPSVAPNTPLIGILLANSPLHELLLGAAKLPLVMTSGNLSEEPIVTDNADALDRLRGVADLFLLHDREIVTRADDSVARVIADRPMVIRRARGYVPRPIQVPVPFEASVLACGAQLKNTFCYGHGHEAVLGPHIGDLDSASVYRDYETAIARMGQFLDVRPEIIAHDLHPDYLSTRFALNCRGAVTVGVQHHHAHAASIMAEHGLRGPVLALAFDGTGYGTDGASWGGELLIADYGEFTRLATFRPLPLPGGDMAIRQPWRTALSLIDDAFSGEAPIDLVPLFRRIPTVDLDVVLRMIHRGFNAPFAHGVGRYFDAFGALLLDRPCSSYEGQIAMALEAAADPDERGRYDYAIDQLPSPWRVDLRAAVRAAVFEVLGGEPAARISARVHNTIAAVSVDLVRAAARGAGRLPVVLSGGCFQNARLAETIRRGLLPEFSVYLHERVPPGDGGLALGQAVVAAAKARSL